MKKAAMSPPRALAAAAVALPALALLALITALAAMAAPSPAAAAEPAATQPAASQAAPPAAWTQLRSLAGNWQVTQPDGKVTRTSYELVANGSALVERMESTGEAAMVTVYTLDGSTPMLTHYCSAGNQPRMRAVAGTNPGVLTFAYLDATNMASPNEGHMHGLKISFADADHFTAEWTFHAGGKELTTPFHYVRVK